MPTLSVKERHDKRHSSNQDGKRSHTRVFLVTMGHISAGPAVAMSGNDGVYSVPGIGSAHPSGDGTVVRSIDAQPHENSGVHFLVTVQYGEPDEDEENGGGSSPGAENPLDAPAEILYGASESTEAYFFDRSAQPEFWNELKYGPWQGKPVVNSAGEPFETYLERESSELTITVITNEATFNASEMDLYSHTINLNPVTIDGVTYAPGTLKLSPITAQRQIFRINGSVQVYYKVTKILKARREGWFDRLLDTGLNELDYPGDEYPVLMAGNDEKLNLRPILNASGLKIQKPWPLNGRGKKRDRPDEPAATLIFQPYASADWSGLRFN
jgi:hypothetical protein